MDMVKRTSVKVGIGIISAGAVLSGLGFLLKISYDNCMRITNHGTAVLCEADQSANFFLTGLPIISIGIIILIFGIKNISLLSQSRPQ
jgi:hypothetical protein